MVLSEATITQFISTATQKHKKKKKKVPLQENEDNEDEIQPPPNPPPPPQEDEPQNNEEEEEEEEVLDGDFLNPNPPLVPEGTRVRSKFDDGCWYNGTILQVDGDDVIVEYDDGELESYSNPFTELWLLGGDNVVG